MSGTDICLQAYCAKCVVKLQIFDRGGKGQVSQSDTSKALYHTLAMPSEEAQRVFRQIDTGGRGYITFGKYGSGEFSAYN